MPPQNSGYGGLQGRDGRGWNSDVKSKFVHLMFKTDADVWLFFFFFLAPLAIAKKKKQKNSGLPHIPATTDNTDSLH